MNKSKIRRLRRHQKQKELEKEKLEKEIQKTQTFLLIRKLKRETEAKERSAKFYQERSDRWNACRNADNLAVPSIITKEGSKCTKKKSPLDLY